MKLIFLALVLLVFIAASACTQKIRLIDEAIVSTDLGQVRGVVSSDARSFKGIPFVAPPVGNLRFSPPAPAQAWTNIYNATRYKPGCPQRCILPPRTCPDEQSEDCLYLNVFTPRLSKLSTLQPVMVFLPGGHFEQGTSGCILYDGTYFANRSNVILVTVNYRLGALGWLADESIGLNGNLGLMDQQAAMEWVQRNIKNFGGDPSQVTLFGQSAGASSIAAHLVSPKSNSLFHKVIMQSDPFTLPLRDLNDASTTGKFFNEFIGCSSLDCLRGKTLDQLLDAQHESGKKLNLTRPLERFLPWTPTVDGDLVTAQTFAALQSGKFHRVPMIIGSVSEEALLFIYMAVQKKLTDAAYAGIVAGVYRTKAPNVLAQYPPVPIIGDKREALGILGTDYIFTAATRYVMNLINNATDMQFPVYNYVFDHAFSFDGWGPNYTFCNGHACHGVELPFVFHTGDQFNVDELRLSVQMVDYWTNFARSGNPNFPHPVDTEWPAFNMQNLKTMLFQTPKNSIVVGYKKDKNDFWDSMGYHFGW